MIDVLQDALERIIAQPGLSRVGTTTLLPSGALVTVDVHPAGGDRFLVSDDRAGFDDILALGYAVNGADERRGLRIAERLGLFFEKGAFSLRHVQADQLVGAIVYVAEASREWSSETVERAARRSEFDLRQRVEQRLRAALPGAKIEHERDFVGSSTKHYRFDLVLDLGPDRKALFEMVTPKSSSLSATHLKFFDIRDAHPDWAREVVVERRDALDNADAVLLSNVATNIRGLDQEWSNLPTSVH